MERLTYEGNFCDIAQCRELHCPYDNNCMQKQVWERLRDYEDAGITPKAAAQAREIEDGLNEDGYSIARMVELMKANKEGRVVVLPCNVGDVLYGFYGDRTILPMVAKWIETSTDGWCVVAQYAPMEPKFYQFSDFGKTVFITREEAKKALEARKDETS